MKMIKKILAFFVISTTCCAQEPSSLKSGVYEGLNLAISKEGVVTGYFNEKQGEVVEKGCSFYLQGTYAAGQVSFISWRTAKLPGTMKVQSDEITLQIPQGRNHPGCMSVLLPQIDQGLSLDLTSSANWEELRVVALDRASFYKEPDETKKMKAYLVKGNVVGVLGAKKKDWLSVEYITDKGKVSGWMPETSLAKLVAPN